MGMNVKKSYWWVCLHIIVGSLILCFYAFYNNYPLVYPDTGTYIISGFDGEVYVDRPLAYGLLIRHISLARTLWLVIWFQGLVVSYLIFRTIKLLNNSKYHLTVYYATVIVLTLFTGVSVHVSQLIPDIFTAVSVLSLFLLLFDKKRSWLGQTILLLLLLIGMIVHNSHLLIITGLLIVITLYYIFWIRTKFSGLIMSRQLIITWLIVISSWFLMPAIHYIYGGDYKISKGSHVFLMARMREAGVLEDYLEKNCESRNYEICKYRENLAYDFLWDLRSPLYLSGGWLENEKEYKTIIYDILKDPEYISWLAIKSVTNTFKQFFSFGFQGIAPQMGPGSPPHTQVRNCFTDEIREYSSSLQFLGRLDFNKLEQRQLIFIFLFLFILVIILSTGIKKQLASYQWYIIVFSLYALIINDLVCSNLSTVASRFQSRLIWILPLVLIPVFNRFGLHSRIRNYISKGFPENN